MRWNITGIIWIIAGIVVLRWPEFIQWTIGIVAILMGIMMQLLPSPRR